MSYRVGIDTGGTFTDLITLDEQSGAVTVTKRPTTPEHPELAVLEALQHSGVDPTEVRQIVLGTTVGTNALLQKQGGRVVYLTTGGFEDIPYIQRVDKKDPYDLQWQKPDPLVDRSDCLGVNERIASDGSVRLALSDEELKRVEGLVGDRIGDDSAGVSLAVNLLFSYAHQQHEAKLKEHLETCFPSLPISISSEVSPIWREYERASTTIIDAYLKPIMSRFLAELARRLHSGRYAGSWTVMKSNGGQMSFAAVESSPVQAMLSGLSGGLIAGKRIGELAGCRNLITLDMGGTSTDVATVVDGETGYTTEYSIDFNIPVCAPFIDMKTVGAGGGSIAWIDKGGLLRIGPDSAGADPGPVCYDRGGQRVTVTDANLVLGRLNPENFLGGEIKLNPAKAKKKIAELGRGLGLSAVEAAEAIVAVAVENTANAIRVLTIERGLDPREFSLAAFGGAGPLHGSAIAAALGTNQILVPPHPGLISAFGTLAANPRIDRRWTRYYRSDRIDLKTINTQLDKMVADILEELGREGYRGEPSLRRSIGMRYAGQNYEREIDLSPGTVTSEGLRALLDSFHEAHKRFYGYSFPEEVVELIHFNVTAICETDKPSFPAPTAGGQAEPVCSRAVYFRPAGWIECPVYRRAALSCGTVLSGPAVVEEMDSTTLVHPGQRLSVSPEGIFIIQWETKVERRSVKDSVSLAIIHNSLVNITREMGIAMMHTAYSPIFSESRDFACALFNRQGEMIAQGEFCPAQLGAIPLTVRWIIEELGLESFAPGDVVIHNDPYRGGCHMPEHMLLKPVFFQDRLQGFAAVIGHVAEIGAKAVGSFASDATEVFQEGLRLPPVKIMARGEHVEDLWKVILANHRTPRNTWGDFHAMLGSLNVAERRLLELFESHGTGFVLEATSELIDYSEKLMRSEITAIPAGTYSFTEVMEDDGIEDRPFAIRAAVVVGSDDILVDYTGSDPQAKGPINATYGVTASATYNALLQITGSHIPRNAGCYRPIKIIAPHGSLLNVKYPGPSVGGNTETQPRIVGAVLGALGQALPEAVMASEGATSCNFLFGGIHPVTQAYYVHYHFEASGWGGRYRSDGNSVQNHIHGNCRNTSVEIFETLFPFLIERYELRPDSGGPGRRRGGLGCRRELQVLAPEITVSVMMDHVKQGALGAFGGKQGGLAGIWIKKAGADRFESFSSVYDTVSPSKFADVVVRKGDLIRIDSAGGGGYGDPAQREAPLVLRDVEQGLISVQAAEQHYQVKIIEKNGCYIVDEQATSALRARKEA